MCLTPKNLGDPSTTPESYHQRKAKIQIQPSDEKMRVSSSSSSTLDEEQNKAELLNHPSTFVHINSEKRQKTQTSRQEPNPQPPELSMSPAFRDTFNIPSRSIWAQPTSLGPVPITTHNLHFWSPEPEYDKRCAKPVTELLSEEESFKIRSVETESNNSQKIFCPNCR